jgi:Metallo-beta-lactamase superfamily
VRPASDFDQIDSSIAIWHRYDSAVKVELYSTCLMTSDETYLVDPIPLQKEVLDELVGSGRVAGIIVTSSNHHRCSLQFAERFSTRIFARSETFSGPVPRRFTRVADNEEIFPGLHVVVIEGAGSGEIALHDTPDGGTFIIGDALINFEPYGFAFLPGKYCSNRKQMTQSIRKLLDYKAERILFAHGTPILAGASDLLKSLLHDAL